MVQIVSPPAVHNVIVTTPEIATVPALVGAPTTAPQSPDPVNPHTVGSSTNLALSLPDVTPAQLLPFYEFHGGNFTTVTTKEKIGNLASVQSC